MRARGRLVTAAHAAEAERMRELIQSAETTTVERDGRTYTVRRIPAHHAASAPIPPKRQLRASHARRLA